MSRSPQSIARFQRLLFSPLSDERGTPPEMFAPLAAEFGLELDVCATAENAVLARYLTREDDALMLPWAPARCWMNPPYGREVGYWVAKAAAEAARGALVVSLLPATTDTAWFHEVVLPLAELRWLRGRLRFVGQPHSAPFGSLVAIFHPRERR